MKKRIFAAVLGAVMMQGMALGTASAADGGYEKYPKWEKGVDDDTFLEQIHEGIKSGKYFADFDGNGIFDHVDALPILQYYVDVATKPSVNWNDKVCTTSVDVNFANYIVRNYSDRFAEEDGEIVLNIALSDQLLANVEKYGDVNGDGKITASDSSLLMRAFFMGFMAGDVNCDNSVDAADASMVLQYYAYSSTGAKIDGFTNDSIKYLGEMTGDKMVDSSDASAILAIYAENSTKK